MAQAKQTSLIITLVLWGTLIGGVMYSHVAFFHGYLSNLPESGNLINSPHGIQDANFWMFIHPLAILSTIITLILNWKLIERRKFILISLGIYVFAIIATATYFVPELIAFADSNKSTVPVSEWFERGQKWEKLSWLRGSFMYIGFITLLIALTKNQAASK